MPAQRKRRRTNRYRAGSAVGLFSQLSNFLGRNYSNAPSNKRNVKLPTRKRSRGGGSKVSLYNPAKLQRRTGMGANVSKNFKMLRYKKPKSVAMYQKLGVQQTYEKTLVMSGLAAEGSQQIEVPGNILLDRTAIRALYDNHTNFYNNTGAATITGNSTVAGKIGHSLNIHTCTSEYRLVNQFDANITIDVYTLQAKNSTSSSRTPRDLWKEGATDLGQSFTDFANNRTFIGSKPYASKTFNMQWRTVHKQTLELGPGQEHKFMLKFHCNRIIDMEYLGEFDTIKGLTTRYMFVTRGSLGDTTSTTNAVGTITTSGAKWVGYIKSTYKFSLLSPWSKQWHREDDLDRTDLANLYTINDQTGGQKNIGDTSTST